VTDIQLLITWAQAHPLQACGAVLALALMALAQVRLTRDQALRWPRLAALVVVAHKVAPVLRGLLKPLAGVGSAKVALEVVDLIFPSTPSSNPPPPSSKEAP
jgi:hypothetical protein